MKIRVGLRDLWESPNASAQKAIQALVDVLGYPVDVEFLNAILRSNLQEYYPDPETFLSNIIGIVEAWASCLCSRLQYDGNAVWTEKFIETVFAQKNFLSARLEVRLSKYHQLRNVFL